MRCLDGITDSMDMNLGKLQETVREKKAWQAVAHGLAKSQESDMIQQRNNKGNLVEMLCTEKAGYP